MNGRGAAYWQTQPGYEWRHGVWVAAAVALLGRIVWWCTYTTVSGWSFLSARYCPRVESRADSRESIFAVIGSGCVSYYLLLLLSLVHDAILKAQFMFGAQMDGWMDRLIAKEGREERDIMGLWVGGWHVFERAVGCAKAIVVRLVSNWVVECIIVGFWDFVVRFV
ncbi:hypothetical protein BKA81DRAFT_358008 [Phyllosticta paracitricarpa]